MINNLESFFRSLISLMNSKNSENDKKEAWCLALYLATSVTHFTCSSYASFVTICLITDAESKCPKRVRYSGVSLIDYNSYMKSLKLYSRLWSLLLSFIKKQSSFNNSDNPTRFESPHWVICIWSFDTDCVARGLGTRSLHKIKLSASDSFSSFITYLRVAFQALQDSARSFKLFYA